MTPRAGVLPGICPDEEAGAGLAPARWPDQKPVRPWGVTRHSPAACGLHPRPTPGSSPTRRLEVERMLADELDYVVGVDPHRDTHALAIVRAGTGAAVFPAQVAASEHGYAQALRLAEREAPGRRAWAIEGTGSYGAGLARFLARRGERVLEVGRTRQERRSHAKTDALDALRAARRVQALTAEERELKREIQALVARLAPALLDEPGIGPVAAAQVLLSWSHRGRFRNDAAFARLAGAAPIPASSGLVLRHRLDPGGDRQLNRALHTIVVSRRKHDPATSAYVERRRAEGKSVREAIRCLKRYLARHLFRLLEAGPIAA